MDSWVADLDLARMTVEERLQQAERHRRMVNSSRYKRLPSILKALLALLS